MIKKDLDWYFSSPERLLLKETFKRGCNQSRYAKYSELTSGINDLSEAVLPTDSKREISQDEYLMEYDPSLHTIHYNNSIPTIAVKIGDKITRVDRIIKASSLQKNIHAIHVLHLTGNPMNLSLAEDGDEETNKIFSEYKQVASYKNVDKHRVDAVSKQKKVGDVGTLHYLKNGRYRIKTLSYDKGYVVIENKDEDNDVIARSVYYKTDDEYVIDTYDDTYMYRYTKPIVSEGKDIVWSRVKKEKHGFSIIPLMYKRGVVAWEYGQTAIEMYEIIDNLLAVIQKRFGQFAIYFKGIVDESTFQSDGSTLVINDPNQEGNGDMKVIEFPEPKGMLEYLKHILNDIQRQCSVTFISPDMIKLGSDPSASAIMLTMKNDIALATQTVNEWSDWANEFTFLTQEGFDLERSKNGTGSLGYFTRPRIKASFQVWTPESNSTLIANLQMEKSMGAISDKTLTEKTPHAAPDEMERKRKEKTEMPTV